MRVFAFALALAWFPSFAFGADPVVLRVGMETRQPPWSFVPGLDYSKEDLRKAPAVTDAQLKALTGLDVEVMNALARRLGATLKVVPTSWFDVEAELLARRFDLILSSWTPNPKTPAGILASAPYCDWGLLVAVRSDDKRVQTYRDLDGLRVGHYSDPAVERSLAAMGQGTLVARDSAEALFDELKGRALDAVVFDSPYVRWRVASDAAFRAVGEPLNHLGYHVGVRREDTALFEKVQAAVKGLRASGEVDEIRRKWEGR